MKAKVIVFFIVFFLLLISYIFRIEEDNKKEVVIEMVNNDFKEDKLKNYVIGVVACEMPASFEIEALKAMSVASRTYTMYKIENNKNYDLYNNDDQCYITIDEMKSKWGKNFDKYYTRIENVVDETSNQYMTYKDDVIISFYFSISNGYTENVENVFSEKLDYLISVDSSFDSEYNYKKDQKEFNLNDFLKKLNIEDKSIKDINIERSKTGRVNYIYINNTKIKGTKFRTLLNLKSTDFNISVYNNLVKIETKGYGHGVGMSQYGANVLAKRGYSYDEILKYYYTGVNIVNK